MIDPNTGKAEDVLICLNIHSKTESGYSKIPTHKLDQAITNAVWKKEAKKRTISTLGSTDEIQ